MRQTGAPGTLFTGESNTRTTGFAVWLRTGSHQHRPVSVRNADSCGVFVSAAGSLGPGEQSEDVRALTGSGGPLYTPGAVTHGGGQPAEEEFVTEPPKTVCCLEPRGNPSGAGMRRTPRGFRGKGRRGRGKPASLASLRFPDTACSTDGRCVARLHPTSPSVSPHFVSLRPVLVTLAVDPTFSSYRLSRGSLRGSHSPTPQRVVSICERCGMRSLGHARCFSE